MKLHKTTITARYVLLLVVFILIGVNAFCGTTTSSDTTKLTLGEYLRKEGFTPTFSVGTGGVSMIGYGTYGISGRAYMPLPLGFRLMTNYTNFIPDTDWDRESHLSASLQYPIVEHGRVNLYASLGANCIVWKVLKEHTTKFSSYTFHEGTRYYFNPVLGMGTEVKINKLITIYNEWNMVNEDAFYTTLGLRANFITLKKRST